ncbi:hypothetical protein NGB36_22465 [Streptomyces sp. RB6PN25]|uniref:Serine-threonine protein kinase n=1 Tax=Streptomyces humicola TaxID=2953240 RepID=A0ABT1Q046_9ACTN|nr:hypothetical protein [Streptomyces humicola]MCQ4083292.1 hypothetical protein [Streptomyces humicola]
MAGIGVDPYWDVSFDADGRAAPQRPDALVRSIASAGLTDLIVFAHAWNNDHPTASRVFRRFFTPFPALLEAGRATARVGYAGVHWPSMRFTDEAVPDYRPSPNAEEAADRAVRQGLDQPTLTALTQQFPGRADDLGRMAELLRDRPASDDALREYIGLLRGFVRTTDHASAHTPREICESFADALQSAGAGAAPGQARVWSGAREVLRWAVYSLTAQRAGVVGESGLGPLLRRIADAAPTLRIHLLGHSLGGRLVCSALPALPREPGCVRSVTLLQGALSHPALADQLHRIDGPLVACHSVHDNALGVLYPLASRLIDGTAFGDGHAAVGYEGVHGDGAAVRMTLAQTAPSAGPFPSRGCVSVDARAVVRAGRPPVGAHSDICHAALGRVVLRAGRIVG